MHKSVTTTISLPGLSTPLTANVTQSARIASKFLVFVFYNFRGYDENIILYEFGRRPDREINMIGQNIKKYLQVELTKT